MPDPWTILTVAAAFFVAAASPGPATLALATVAMRNGRGTGLRFAAGLAVGLAVWGGIAATGLGAVLSVSAEALVLLKIAGGLYLFWLATLSARAALRDEAPAITDRHAEELARAFRRGLLLNLSNPKAVFAWMSVLVLGTGAQTAPGQLAITLLICAGLGGAIYGVYALVFSTSGAMRGYARLRRGVEGLAAILFTLAGLTLIRSAFARA